VLGREGKNGAGGTRLGSADRTRAPGSAKNALEGVGGGGGGKRFPRMKENAIEDRHGVVKGEEEVHQDWGEEKGAGVGSYKRPTLEKRRVRTSGKGRFNSTP